MSERTRVVIIYSHKDRPWFDWVQVFLRPVHDLIDGWDDTRIAAGDGWHEIEREIVSARVIILLISHDFLASDFMKEQTLQLLLAKAWDQGARIMTSIIDYSMLDDPKAFLMRYWAINSPAEPLKDLSEEERNVIWAEFGTLINRWAVPVLPGSAHPDANVADDLPGMDSDSASSAPRPSVIHEPVVRMKIGASVPGAMRPGDEGVLWFAAYVANLERAVRKELAAAEPANRLAMGFDGGCWTTGTTVLVRLDCVGLTIDRAEQQFLWEGDANILSFIVRVPADARPASTVLRFFIAYLPAPPPEPPWGTVPVHGRTAH
jgi:hypothetical protein